MTKAAELAKMGEVLTNSQIGGRRNIVINGAMQVAQRGTSSTGLGANGDTYLLDRFRLSAAGSTAGRFTLTQTADGPSGFANCLKIACTTADTSIGASENLVFVTAIEGQDLQQFKKGASDAEKFTVSFYVKGHDSATYTFELYDGDNSRQVSQTFSVTTDWARVILTFPADTSGAFGDDNGASLYLQIHLHAGSNYTSGTLNTSWAGATTANRVSSSANSVFESTSATFSITGLQLEVGSQATPFEHRSFAEELDLCYRYYNKSPSPHPTSPPGGLQANEAFPMVGNMDGSTTGAFMYVFPKPMREAPTAIEQSGTASDYSIRVTSDSNGTSVPTATGFTSTHCLINLVSSGAGFTSQTAAFMRMENADAFVAFDAEI